MNPAVTHLPKISRFPAILAALAVFLAPGLPAQPGNQNIFPGLTGQELLDSLNAAYKPAAVLNYDHARDTLFGVIYNVNDSLSCVYSDFTIYLDPLADPSADADLKGINTEHTWPQSKGAGGGQAQSNMHHLYPAKSNINSSRGDDPFADINDRGTNLWFRKDQALTAIPLLFIEEYSEKDNDSPELFEPREDHKGNAARAMFYFYTLYRAAADSADPAFFPLQKNFLFTWHQNDPVDSDEFTRTNLIAAYQDNKANPFVLDSSLARRAYFFEGAPAKPQPGDILITEFMANPAAVSDAIGEYLEIYNATANAFDINGLTLRDDGSDYHRIVQNDPLIIPPLSFLVLGRNADPLLNGGYTANYQFAGFILGNDGDEIILERPDNTGVCRINYSNGDPFGAGVSAELANVAFHVNGVTQQSNYTAATTVYGAGDLGSPGGAGNTQGTGIACIPGWLGNVTEPDTAANSTDGLVILTYDAGMPVLPAFEELILIGFGNANAALGDTLTNSTDALVILSHDAGLPTPFAVGQPVCLPPPGREKR